MRGVDRAAVQVELPGGTQLGQDQLVQPRPHPGFGPRNADPSRRAPWPPTSTDGVSQRQRWA